jgi:hypothetical protein
MCVTLFGGLVENDLRSGAVEAEFYGLKIRESGGDLLMALLWSVKHHKTAVSGT